MWFRARFVPAPRAAHLWMFARGGIAFMLGCAWHRAAPDTSLVRIVAVLYPAHLNSRAAMASAVEAARPRPNSVTTPGAGRQSD